MNQNANYDKVKEEEKTWCEIDRIGKNWEQKELRSEKGVLESG